MTYSIEKLIERRQGEQYPLHRQYINTSLARGEAMWTSRKRREGEGSMRVLQGVLVLISAAAMAQAQQAPCVVVGNVVTIQMPNPLRPLPPGGTYYPAPLMISKPRLSAEDFVAHDGFFHRVPIVSAEPDKGPRRIVLLEVFGEGWRAYARQPKRAVWATPGPELTAILSTARPGDSFALLAVGGPRIEAPFGSSRGALRAAIEMLSHPDPNAPDGPDLFDGLLEATTWFGSPQVGDSILEFGGVRRWRWDRLRAAQLHGTLVSRGIRLFTLGGGEEHYGGDSLAGGVQKSPFLQLCEESGGGAQTIGYLGPGSDALDMMLWEWKEAAKSLYEEAILVYLLRLPRTGPRVRIQLKLEAERSPAWSQLYYPSPLPVCP